MNTFESFQEDILCTKAVEGFFISTSKSRERKISEYREIEKAIAGFIDMIEVQLGLEEDVEKLIDKTKSDDKETIERITNEFMDKIRLSITKRGDAVDGKKLARAYFRLSRRYKDRADLKKAEVQEAEKQLYDKCLQGGEFFTKLTAANNRCDALIKAHNARIDKYKNAGKGYPHNALKTVAVAIKYTSDQIMYTFGDAKGVRVYIGRGADFSAIKGLTGSESL